MTGVTLARRGFLEAPVALAADAAAGFACIGIARAAPIEAPTILSLQPAAR